MVILVMMITKRQLQTYFAEFLCTFLFGFGIYATIMNESLSADNLDTTNHLRLMIPISIAFISIVIIYTFIDHTICHFNPAITVSAIIFGKLEFFSGLIFIVMQIGGFICAALMCLVVFPGSYGNIIGTIRANPPENVSNVNVFFSEFFLTAILVFVVFMLAINSLRDPAVSLYGEEPLPNRSIVAPIAIGLTLGVLAYYSGSVSGGLYNPGLAFAPMILTNTWNSPWEYFVGEFTGGLVGGFIQIFLLYK